MKVIRPFGPTIAMTNMPENLVKKLNDYVDQILTDEKKSQDLKKAESILEAIKNDEKVMQKQQIKRAKSKKLVKDW